MGNRFGIAHKKKHTKSETPRQRTQIPRQSTQKVHTVLILMN